MMQLYEVELTVKVRCLAHNPGEAATTMEQRLREALKNSASNTLPNAPIAVIAYPTLKNA